MRRLPIALLLLTAISIHAQQTVGLFQLTEQATDGYVLLAPIPSEEVYLIDNCGREVHTWNTPSRPALNTYLLDDGSLLRTGRTPNDNFTGNSGRVMKVAWDGTVEFDYQFSNDTIYQHHDIEPMPNGNFLVVLWHLYSPGESTTAGRVPADVPDGGIWAETIWEVEPVDLDTYNVVWQWSAWDHLIQNHSSFLPNFGEPADHPRRIDINYRAAGGAQTAADWLHFNSVSYDPVQDVIVTSSRFWDEVWVIDHATTTAEAAGPAGDLLYRWGNPEAYGRGTAADRTLFGQHDARFVPEGLPDAGKLSAFSNGNGRPGGDLSSVDLIDPARDADGNFLPPPSDDAPFGPETSTFAYPPSFFFSQRISGAHQLPNGNWFITDGPFGRLFEADANHDIVWEYVNPITNTGPLTQGENVGGNAVFRATRFLPDHPAFAGRDLTPGVPLELNPIATDCSVVSTVKTDFGAVTARVFPNPVGEEVTVWFETALSGELLVFDGLGRVVARMVLRGTDQVRLDARAWQSGLYVFSLDGKLVGRVVK